VPGKYSTDQQVRLFMQHRKSQTQKVAAARAGISERSARRIDQQAHQPLKEEWNWRTRKDPPAEV